LSLGAAAGLAGISKGYLSKLENGKASFTRRGLVEDLAAALGCSPIDLTGLPAVAPDRRSMAAASAIPGLTAALHDTTLDDVPEVPTRPLAELVDLADRANAAAGAPNRSHKGRGGIAIVHRDKPAHSGGKPFPSRHRGV
jgi:transcriptional regulator with XRE-family HTH domain